MAFGPLLVPAGPVEGWIGISIGRIFQCARRPPNVTNVPGLPVPGGVRHAITRFAVHPTNPAMVAVSTLPGRPTLPDHDQYRGCAGAGRAGTFPDRFRQSGWIRRVSRAGADSRRAVRGRRYGDRADFRPGGLQHRRRLSGARRRYGGAAVRAAAGGVTAAALGFAPVTITISSAGAVGAARFTFQAAGLAAARTAGHRRSGHVGATGLVLRFAGGPFVVGHAWTIASNNTIVPGGGAVGTIEVLARLHGRVFLTYDRGTRWIDISFPRTRPAAGFDADSGRCRRVRWTSVRFAVNGGSIDLYAGGARQRVRHDRAAGRRAGGGQRPLATVQRTRRALPLTLVNDIEPVAGTRRLRAATFGRGIWDCNLAAGVAQPQLLIRQTLIEDGRTYPRPFPPPIPDDPRLPAGAVWLDHAHAFDIRIDSAPFDFFDDRVNGVEFDEQLAVNTLLPLAEQAVYVQVHNWG